MGLGTVRAPGKAVVWSRYRISVKKMFRVVCCSVFSASNLLWTISTRQEDARARGAPWTGD